MFRAIIVLSFGVQSHHRIFVRRSEPSLLSLAFRVIIVLSFGVQSHHRFSVLAFRSLHRFSVLAFRAIIITSQFGVQSLSYRFLLKNHHRSHSGVQSYHPHSESELLAFMFASITHPVFTVFTFVLIFLTSLPCAHRSFIMLF